MVDDEARKNICAILVQYEEALPEVEEINMEYFKNTPKYRTILESIRKMFEDGKPVDSISLRAYLKMNRLFKKAGGEEMIGDLAAADVAPSKLWNYVEIVRKEYEQSRLGNLANEILLNISSGVDPDELSKTVSDRMMDMQRRSIDSQIKKLGVVASQTLKALTTTPDVGISTGYYDLDRIIGGLTPNFIIIAGRPSMGKSAFVQNDMLNIARQGIPGLIFSLEMSQRQTAIRLLSIESGISYMDISRGKYSDIQYERLREAAEKLHNYPIYIDDSPDINLGQMYSRTMVAIKKYGIQYIAVDYLQLISSTDPRKHKIEVVTDVSKGLKALTKRLDIPVIAVSQLSRKIEERKGDKRPQLSDLRESGQIEQDADIVLFVHRPDYWDKKEDVVEESEDDPSSFLKTAEIIIAKQRNGPTGNVELIFNKKCMRFSNARVNYGG